MFIVLYSYIFVLFCFSVCILFKGTLNSSQSIASNEYMIENKLEIIFKNGQKKYDVL